MQTRSAGLAKYPEDVSFACVCEANIKHRTTATLHAWKARGGGIYLRTRLRGLHGRDSAGQGVPSIEAALSVAHDDQVAPCRDGRGNTLRRA